jgi:hypothetical protein
MKPHLQNNHSKMDRMEAWLSGRVSTLQAQSPVPPNKTKKQINSKVII